MSPLLHSLCPNGGVTNQREGRVHSLARHSREKRWVLQGREKLLRVTWSWNDPRQDSGFAVFLVGMNSIGGWVMNTPGALDAVSHTRGQHFSAHLAISASTR